MKSVFTLFFGLAILILILAFSKTPEFNSNKNTIGDVKYSLLPPSQFEQLNQGWVLMDGRNVEGSEFQRITGFDTIPDATNQFIRGMGGAFDSADGAKNGSKRTVGSFQGYATARPRNNFTTDTYTDSHNHEVFSGRSLTWDEKIRGRGNSTYTGNAAHDGTNKWKHVSTDTRNHSHDITLGGDLETRPSNIALYTYVKIN